MLVSRTLLSASALLVSFHAVAIAAQAAPLPASGAAACQAARRRGAATREPSRATPNVQATSYTIDATIDPAVRALTARCDVGIEATQAGVTDFGLDFVGLTVSSVLEGGTTPVAFAQVSGELTITPATPLALAERRTYAIAYSGTPRRGLYVDAENQGVAFTFAEPSDARYWFPSRDLPADKVEWYRGRITVPAGYLVASNGDLQSVVANGNGTETWSYFHDKPITTYLISLAISRYQTFTQTSPSGIPFKHFVYPSHFAEAQFDFANTPAMMDFYETKYWPYAFATYGMAVAPMGGAMEHQTMTTFDPGLITGDRSRESVVAHELAHHWWGDMVTCEEWMDIWLNEGFASYFDPLFMQSFYGEARFRQDMKDNRFIYFLYEPYEGRFPIYDPAYMWGATVYEKGSWILHMLRHDVSDATFTLIMQEWARRYQYGTATTADFIDTAETIAGVQLDAYFDQWVFKAGYPELRVAWWMGGGAAKVRIDQIQLVTPQVALFDVPLDLLLQTPAGDVRTTVRVSRTSETFTVAVPAPPTRVILDPDVRLLHKPTGLDGYVAAPGPDPANPAEVQAFTPSGAPLGPVIQAYGVSSYGANVGAANVNGGALDELLTGPGPGAVFGPHVRAFGVDGTALQKVSFYAYGTLKYGANVAGGDVDLDGYGEIVTGPGPGAVFGPHVRGFDVDAATAAAIPGINYFAYGTLKYGVNVAAGSIDADGRSELLTGPGPGAVFGPQVRAFDYDGTPATPIAKVNFTAYTTPSWGVNVGAGDLDADGYAEMVTGPGPGSSYLPHVKAFDYDGTAVAAMPKVNLIPFGTYYGAVVGATDEDGDGADGILVAPGPDAQAPALVELARMDGSGNLEELYLLFHFGNATRGARVAGGRFQELGIAPPAAPQRPAAGAMPSGALLRGVPVEAYGPAVPRVLALP